MTKFAPKLNINTVTPTSWGRQNVQNALNIFDYTTISGLVQFSENDKNGKSLSTASFLTLFRNMWEILNIKTPKKGIEKRLCYANPFCSKTFKNDFRILEIKEFIDWLEKWEPEEFDSNGKLTYQTFHSLILTFKSLLSFLDILFNNPEELGLDPQGDYYFLTGNLQTDILEKRFGIYRQLNGAAYLMTFKELINAEKK